MYKDLAAQIIELLNQRHKLTTSDVTSAFGVSEATARRFFKRLADMGEVRRIHGGIEEVKRDIDPAWSYLLRMQWYPEIKMAIARKTVELIKDCKTVFIDGGTTTAHLGKLPLNPQLRVITNSMLLVEVMNQRPHERLPEIILTGGRINHKSAILLGTEAERCVEHFHADAAIISGSAIDSSYLYDNNEEPASLQRRMIEHSDKVIVMADASKFGKTASSCVVPVGKITTVVSNKLHKNIDIIRAIENKGVKFEYTDFPCTPKA